MIKKVFKVIILIVILLQIACVSCFALNLTSIANMAENFVESGNANDAILNAEETVRDVSWTLSTIFSTVGIIISVILVLVLGIRFMLGSVEEKAEIKKNLVPYIVGIVVIFGAFVIWSIMLDILQH